MFRPASLIVVGALVAVLARPLRAEGDFERRTPVVRAVEKAAPAVVNIAGKQVRGPEFYRDWFGVYRVPARESKSVGSGVIVHEDGYVITNSHVIRRATEILVTLDDDGEQKEYEAVLLAENQENDLALVKIKADRKFPTVALGRSDDLMLGEPAIAVGNPFGVGKTVTTGVISATGRKVSGESAVTFEDFIQTDAAINPGNSGGALLNIHGEMIGVNTAIIRGGEGIAFAIPVNRVKAILARLSEEAVVGTNLGFRPQGTALGVVVRALDEDGVVAGAGLKAGDLIRRVDARDVRDLFDLASSLVDHQPGDRIRFDVRREDREFSIDAAMPEAPLVAYVARRMGIRPGELPAQYQAKGLFGVLVLEVIAEGPAARVGVQPGDLLIAVDGREIREVADLVGRLQGARSDETVDLEVIRGRRRMTGSLTLR